MTCSSLADARTGKNGRHSLVGLLRQSVFSRLAGYEDVNDAERLRHDPAMRWIVGGKASHSCAASPSPIGRFETQWLTADKNLLALADLSGQWIDLRSWVRCALALESPMRTEERNMRVLPYAVSLAFMWTTVGSPSYAGEFTGSVSTASGEFTGDYAVLLGMVMTSPFKQRLCVEFGTVRQADKRIVSKEYRCVAYIAGGDPFGQKTGSGCLGTGNILGESRGSRKISRDTRGKRQLDATQ
jgi:hypothetical protein